MGSSAETVVEHLFIIAKQQNRENLDWKKLSLELQFRILDPYKHEETPLKIKLIAKLKKDKRCKAKQPL